MLQTCVSQNAISAVSSTQCHAVSCRIYTRKLYVTYEICCMKDAVRDLYSYRLQLDLLNHADARAYTSPVTAVQV